MLLKNECGFEIRGKVYVYEQLKNSKKQNVCFMVSTLFF